MSIHLEHLDNLSSLKNPATQTLAAVISRLDAMDNLPLKRRRDLTSAVRTFSRLVGSAPERLAADPAVLSGRLPTASPAASGITPARWRNVKSLVREALRLTGAPVFAGRQRNGMSDRWDHLLESAPKQAQRIGLSRLARFAGSMGWEPKDVNDVTMEIFADRLRTEALMVNPEKTVAVIRRGWNALVGHRPDLELTSVALPTSSREYVHDWSELPDGLKREALAYLDRCVNADLLDLSAPRPIRPATAANRDWLLRQAATILVTNGAPANSLGDLVGEAAVKAILTFLYERSGRKMTGAQSQILALLRSIAKDWCGADPDHLEALKAMTAKVRVDRVGLTAKNKDRLRPFQDEAILRKLLDLPDRLEGLARLEAKPNRHAALLVQTALLIELLISAPMRIGNLAALDIERHFRRSSTKRQADVHLVLSRLEIKNRVDLDYPLPSRTVALLDGYIRVYRPLLEPVPTSALFPGLRGGAKTVRMIRDQIKDAIWRHIGVEIHPHLFRHLCAQIFLEDQPGAYEAVRRILGHTSVRTTTNFYTGLETAAAVRHFDAMVDRRRRTSNTKRSG